MTYLKIGIVLLSSCIFLAFGQAAELPEVGLSYRIRVALEPETRELAGTETIRWTNPGKTIVGKARLHLYLNAFSHTQTTFLDEASTRWGDYDDFVGKLVDRYGDPWGKNEPVAIRQGDVSLDWRPIAPDDGNPLDRSLIEVDLAHPVSPNEILELSVEFAARLPVPIQRTGGYEDFFLAAQWYPKLSAFDTAGTRHSKTDRWAARQFHSATEFYADFADYDVEISVPPGWTVGATGREAKPGDSSKAKEKGKTRYRFQQRAVHDFAFVAGRNLAVSKSQHTPTGGSAPVDIHVILPAEFESQASRWRNALVGTMDVMGARVGPYPYDTMTLVLPPFRASAVTGMEYPTFILGYVADPFWEHPLVRHNRIPEEVIVHEFIHQYFYAMVATNEVEEAFMDEGFTTYWTTEVLHDLYGEPDGGRFLNRPVNTADLYHLSLARSQSKILGPIRINPTWLMTSVAAQAYYRPWSIFRTAALIYGQDTMDAIFADFFAKWAFRHPDFDDFLDIAEKSGGKELREFIDEAFEKQTIPDYRIEKIRSEKWLPPLGILVTEAGEKTITGENRDKTPRLGLDPRAEEPDGKILVIVTDPGWRVQGEYGTGGVRCLELEPRQGAPEDGFKVETDVFYKSSVSIAGPAWRNLPVDVLFRFADGAELQTRWDGKSIRREYQFLRNAPLTEARVDPRRKLAVDPIPENNALRKEADPSFTENRADWVGALIQWLASGASQWL